MTSASFLQNTPSPHEVKEAKQTSEFLAHFIKNEKKSPLFLNNEGKNYDIPDLAVEAISNIFEAIAKGQRVAILLEDEEISPTQAAEILNVSRPFVTKLIDEGEIPHRKVGTHRRIFTKDILEYKVKSDKRSQTLLDELVSDAQKYNMGYGD